eukprot:TRINITY_DN6795_c0_g4_i1.p2 TRINITY_DN6795_c0_g4~~TRINITY_DN6795_c0_g4_i1.p2  ORF type:complete len:277 (+),score=55.08 TRINITY_DN6795_c0_g4_i1:54-884(+)
MPTREELMGLRVVNDDEEQAREGNRWAHALRDPATWKRIVDDIESHYYYTTCWLPSFYSLMCYYGFVSIAEEPHYLIPELQITYSVLEPGNLHVERGVRKRMRNRRYKLTVNQRPEEVWRRINKHHTDNWLGPRYFSMMRAVWRGIEVPLVPRNESEVQVSSWFQPYTVELVDLDTNELVAGEIGYTVGCIYTSLTGFSDTTGHPSCGKIQLCALVKYLVGKGIHFVNLGHPPYGERMKYKTDIGAKVLPRKDFLDMWSRSRDGKVDIEGETDVSL